MLYKKEDNFKENPAGIIRKEAEDRWFYGESTIGSMSYTRCPINRELDIVRCSAGIHLYTFIETIPHWKETHAVKTNSIFKTVIGQIIIYC